MSLVEPKLFFKPESLGPDLSKPPNLKPNAGELRKGNPVTPQELEGAGGQKSITPKSKNNFDFNRPSQPRDFLDK